MLALQLLIYLFLLIGTTLYVALCWVMDGRLNARHQGIALGLLVSPLGFILPYAILAGASWLLYGSHPPSAVLDWPPLLGIPCIALVLLGPLIGPPIIVGLAAVWYVRRRQHHS